MEIIKGIYQHGVIELLSPLPKIEKAEVLVIFPEVEKKITKICGLFRDHKINYDQVEEDLKNLSNDSENHIRDEVVPCIK